MFYEAKVEIYLFYNKLSVLPFIFLKFSILFCLLNIIISCIKCKWWKNKTKIIIVKFFTVLENIVEYYYK